MNNNQNNNQNPCTDWALNEINKVGPFVEFAREYIDTYPYELQNKLNRRITVREMLDIINRNCNLCIRYDFLHTSENQESVKEEI